MEEIDPTEYRYHLTLSVKGKTMIDTNFENIEHAVRAMNNLASEWNIETHVIPLYATGERNGARLELKGIKK